MRYLLRQKEVSLCIFQNTGTLLVRVFVLLVRGSRSQWAPRKSSNWYIKFRILKERGICIAWNKGTSTFLTYRLFICHLKRTTSTRLTRYFVKWDFISYLTQYVLQVMLKMSFCTRFPWQFRITSTVVKIYVALGQKTLMTFSVTVI